jgi:MoaA/NifB/PqqE/SkfB family radical SAM enzyme
MNYRNIPRLIYKALRQPGYALRVFVVRLIALFFYWCGKGKAFCPEAITFFLTYRCNLSCVMCGQNNSRSNSKDAKQDLTFGLAENVIKEVSKFRPNITLFGGEPLLNKDCFKIIYQIKKSRMHCLVITNGALVEDFAESIVNSGLDELNVSIDGKGELHDRIRGMPGLYDKIIKGLNKIADLKQKGNKNLPLVNIQCTATKYNLEHLEELLDVAPLASADSLTFHNLIFTSSELMDKQKIVDNELKCKSEYWNGFIFDPGFDGEILNKKFRLIRKIWKEKVKTGKFFSLDFYPNFTSKELEEYYRKDFRTKGTCLSPWITAYVFPEGDLRPCLNSDYSFGSVMDLGFNSSWNSEQALRFRRLLKNKSLFPGCIRCTELYRY